MTRITPGDISDVLRLVVLAPLAWLLPQRSWPAVGTALARLQGRIVPERRRDLEQRTPAYLLGLTGLTRRDLVRHQLSRGYQEEMVLLRAYRPGGWQPALQLEGTEGLDAALALGKGVILWVEDIHFASFAVKMAFAQRGYQVSHLSRPSHGFSGTPFARRYLNPIQTRFEDRYLRQRLTLTRDDSSSLRRMRAELGAGGIVSITVGNNGSQVRTVPFFDADIDFATGAVTLARGTGAALLPVFARRLDSGAFVVSIEAPLNVERSRDQDAPYLQLAGLLEAYLRRYPLQWRGWAFRGPFQTPDDNH
jgi:lauroyl/myristoyl acyltransferase